MKFRHPALNPSMSNWKGPNLNRGGGLRLYLTPTYTAVLSSLPRELNNHSHVGSPSHSNPHEGLNGTIISCVETNMLHLILLKVHLPTIRLIKAARPSSGKRHLYVPSSETLTVASFSETSPSFSLSMDTEVLPLYDGCR